MRLSHGNSEGLIAIPRWRAEKRRGRACFRLWNLQSQVRELHRLLGKKTLEAEILKEAPEHATGQKATAAAAVAVEGSR
jgi:hypothetical protein